MVETPRVETSIQNSEKLLAETLRLHTSIRTIIGKSEAADYFDQPKLWRENSRLYLTFNPNPLSPEDLTTEQIAFLYSKIGPDFFRLRAINPGILKGDFLPLGGSCAIETWGMELLNSLKKYPELRARLAEVLLSFAPTISHVTGAILATGNFGVHFIEDGLWGQRIEDEYRVQNGRSKTTQAYQKIHEAVERRAKLASGDPNYQLIPVNFDELGLLEGPLERWFEEMGMEFDPNFRIAQVIYTYVGPELLELVKNSLITRHGIPQKLLETYTIATRLKQIDHNDWDATMAELKPIILGEPPTEKQTELLKNYPFAAGLAIAKWIRDNIPFNRSQPSGFFDLPYDGRMYHMRNFYRPTGPDEIEDLILRLQNDPRILREGNLETHLQYLRGFLEISPIDRTLPPQKPDKVVINELKTQIQRIRLKIYDLERQAQTLESIIQIITDDQYQTNPEIFQSNMDYIKRRFESFVVSLRKRYNLEEASIQELIYNDKINPLDKKDLQMWLWLVNFFISYGRQKLRISIEIDNSLLSNFPEYQEQEYKDKLYKLFSRELTFLKEELDKRKNSLLILQNNLQSIQSIQNNKVSYPKPEIFPLNRNLIIMYATQFTFDPDFRDFIEYIAQVSEDRSLSPEEKRIRIARASQMIFPKLETYLRYIFEGGEYPVDLRNSRIFNLSYL